MRPGSFLLNPQEVFAGSSLAASLVAGTDRLWVLSRVLFRTPPRLPCPRLRWCSPDTATGVARPGETNGAGIFYFGSVPIGPYVLSVEAPGFERLEGNSPWRRADRRSQSGFAGRQPDQQGGGLRRRHRRSPPQGAQISDVKDAARIHDLPINGRQISNLFTLTPGVEGGVDSNGNTVGGGAPRTNGMMVGSTEILLDGMSYVDRYGGGISRVQPGLDTDSGVPH